MESIEIINEKCHKCANGTWKSDFSWNRCKNINITIQTPTLPELSTSSYINWVNDTLNELTYYSTRVLLTFYKKT